MWRAERETWGVVLKSESEDAEGVRILVESFDPGRILN